MQFLVDTDWVIDYLNGIQAVSQRFDELRSQGIGLSIVSLAELYEGVLGADDPKADESALLDFLADIDVLAVDLTVCRILADERRRLRATGTLISDFDMLIGATAIRHSLTLLTNNRGTSRGCVACRSCRCEPAERSPRCGNERRAAAGVATPPARQRSRDRTAR